jgi:hypothetical protein
MKKTETNRELRINFKLDKNTSKIDRILYHIYRSQGMIIYSLRRGKTPYYFRKQIEVAKRKIKPFKLQLHPVEKRTLNF